MNIGGITDQLALMMMMRSYIVQSLHATVAPPANGHYLVCKSLDTEFTVQKYIYPSVSKVHAASFHVSLTH